MKYDLLYIKKKSKTRNWSNVLELQYQNLKTLNKKTDLFEIDTSSILNYLKSLYNLFKIRNNYQVFYVNHIICAYPAIFSLLLSKSKWYLALHESEPVLGLKFAFKNFKSLSYKEFLRYTFLFKIPLFFFNNVIVLNAKQIKIKRKNIHYKVLNYLGVNIEIFRQSIAVSNELKLFYPNNSNRPEKGGEVWKNFILQNKYDSREAVNINFDEMKDLYNWATVVMFSSIYETYSIACLEAMAFNKYIFTSKGLGLADNLLNNHTKEELREFGFVIYDTETINQDFEYIKQNVYKGISANTRSLLIKNKLNDIETDSSLLEYIMSV